MKYRFPKWGLRPVRSIITYMEGNYKCCDEVRMSKSISVKTRNPNYEENVEIDRTEFSTSLQLEAEKEVDMVERKNLLP